MKFLLFILLGFTLLGKSPEIYAWDSTAAKYMPLQIGNQWVYTSSLTSFSGSGTSIDKYIITGTQIINGKLYYNLTGIHVLISGFYSCGSRLFSANTQLRIDSLTMNLFRTGVCNNNAEGLVDSLAAKFRDSSLTCFNLNSTKTCFNDSSDFYIFNTFFKSKRFTTVDINGGNDQTFLEGIGLAKYNASITNYTCYQILKGCIINGIIYGDTSMIIGINQTGSEVPEKFELSQNFPNPFNPLTHFGFRVADFGLVSLTIYNALGKEVQELVNQQLQPGTYQAEWDASAYPSGVYYYRIAIQSDKLESEKFTETKKMVLIK